MKSFSRQETKDEAVLVGDMDWRNVHSVFLALGPQSLDSLQSPVIRFLLHNESEITTLCTSSINDDQFELLCSILARTKIRNLDLERFNHLTSRALHSLLKQQKIVTMSLESLNMSDARLYDEDVVDLALKLSKSTVFKHLKLEQTKMTARGCNALIQASDNHLETFCVFSFSRFVHVPMDFFSKLNSKLRSGALRKLSFNISSPEQVHLLADSLPQPTCELRAIKIGFDLANVQREVDFPALHAFALAISRSKVECVEIYGITLDFVAIDLLSSSPMLNKLVLRYCNLTDSVCAALLVPNKGTRRIQCLDLAANFLTSRALLLLAEAMKSSFELREVNVDGNYVTREVVYSMIAAARSPGSKIEKLGCGDDFYQYPLQHQVSQALQSMKVARNLLALRSAQEIPRFALRTPIGRIPQDLCRGLLSMMLL